MPYEYIPKLPGSAYKSDPKSFYLYFEDDILEVFNFWGYFVYIIYDGTLKPL